MALGPNELDDQNIHVYCYRSPTGLNLYDEYAATHEHVELRDLNTEIVQGFTILDIDSNPAVKNTYTEDATIDGSIFQYNTLAKSTVTLKCWLSFSDYSDYTRRKQIVLDYFTQKAAYGLMTSYNPSLTAICYLNKIQIPLPQGDQHDVFFDIVFDNPSGYWTTSDTAWMEKHWNDPDKHFATDLSFPVTQDTYQVTGNSWKLHEGMNRIFNPGSTTIKMSSPTDYFSISINTSGDHFILTSMDDQGGWINCHGKDISGTVTITNLDLRDSHNNPINDQLYGPDLWLFPGWNQLKLIDASGGYIDTSFHFAHF